MWLIIPFLTLATGANVLKHFFPPESANGGNATAAPGSAARTIADLQRSLTTARVVGGVAAAAALAAAVHSYKRNSRGKYR